MGTMRESESPPLPRRTTRRARVRGDRRGEELAHVDGQRETEVGEQPQARRALARLEALEVAHADADYFGYLLLRQFRRLANTPNVRGDALDDLFVGRWRRSR